MILISLTVDNIYLELKELIQIPYSRQIFMHKFSRGKKKPDQKYVFETQKCVQVHYNFRVFCFILMNYIVIDFLLKKSMYMP